MHRQREFLWTIYITIIKSLGWEQKSEVTRAKLLSKIKPTCRDFASGRIYNIDQWNPNSNTAEIWGIAGKLPFSGDVSSPAKVRQDLLGFVYYYIKNRTSNGWAGSESVGVWKCLYNFILCCGDSLSSKKSRGTITSAHIWPKLGMKFTRVNFKVGIFLARICRIWRLVGIFLAPQAKKNGGGGGPEPFCGGTHPKEMNF